MSPVLVRDLRAGSLPVERPDPTTQLGSILGFLEENAERAYRAVEVAMALDIDQHTVGAALRRLRARGLVEKEGPYWYALPPEDASHLRAVIGLTRDLNERLGSEDPSRWANLPLKD